METCGSVVLTVTAPLQHPAVVTHDGVPLGGSVYGGIGNAALGDSFVPPSGWCRLLYGAVDPSGHVSSSKARQAQACSCSGFQHKRC